MKLLFSSLLFLCTSFLPAQTWVPVVAEGGTAILPATVAMPIAYRYGAGSSWCDVITVSKSTSLTVSNGAMACTVGGVAAKGGDPDPNVAKQLEVLQTTTAFVVQTVLNGKTVSVQVPAFTPVTPPPPPPPPPPPTGPSTTATVAAPDSSSRLYWCDVTLNTTTQKFTLNCTAATAGQ